MFKAIYHRYIFIVGTIVIAVGLPLSPFLTSLGQFILAGNWLVEFNFRQKILLLKKRISIAGFISIYIIHIIWLINSANFGYAFHDLKIKLPLLILPLIYGTTPPFSKSELKIVIYSIIAGVVSSTLVSSYLFFGFSEYPAYDPRASSIFISHIRLAVLVDIVIYFLVWLMVDDNAPRIFNKKILLLILAWLLTFIFIIGAFTGMALFILTFPFLIFFLKEFNLNKTFKNIFKYLVVLFFIFCLGYVYISFKKYTDRTVVNLELLEKFTPNGNQYTHLNKTEYENKDLVWTYVCSRELEQEWNKRSKIHIDGLDEKGQAIRYTLIRYLTSLGYRKDSVGVSALNEDDIHYIEGGYANHLFTKRFSVYPKLYQIFWQIEMYAKYGDPNNHSITQRFEFVKNGYNTAKNNIWFGTGTGDVDDAIKQQYIINQSVLNPKHRHRPHNQYLTLIVGFGVIGFLLITVLLFASLWYERKNIDLGTFFFLLLMAFSMTYEDTFETQAGATIFAFFLSVFILGRNRNEVKE